MTDLQRYYEHYWQSRLKHKKLYRHTPPRTQVAIKYLPPFTSKILDLGCGEGELGKALQDLPHHLTGVDISKTALKLAKPYYHRIIQADITNKQDQKKITDKFDVIVSTEVIEHLFYPEKLLQFSCDHLVDNGTLILSFPNTAWWKYRLDLMFQGKFIDETPTYTQHDHVQFFTVHTLRSLAASNGLNVTVIDAAYSLPWYFGRFPQSIQRLVGNMDPNLWGYQVVLVCHKVSKKLVVAQLIKDYLNPSENWLHSQITTHTKTSPIVLTKNIRHPQLFPAIVFKYQLASDHKKPVLLRKVLALWERIRNLLFLTELSFYIKIIKQMKVRLIHAHYGPTGYFAIPLKFATKLPLVVSFYGSDINSLPQIKPQWKLYYRQLFQHANAILVKGPRMKEKILDLGCMAKKIHTIDAGVEVEKIAYHPRIATKHPKLLVAARLVEFKGIEYAIKSLPDVLKKFPRTKMTIIGSGPQESSLKHLAKKLHLSTKIKFISFVSLPEFIDLSYQHDIFLSPSITTDKHEQEGIPTSVVQLAATGMPIIATNHSDIPTIIIPNHNGLLIPEKNPQALAKAIIHLVKHPRLWSKFAANGRKLVEAKFNAPKQTAKREKLYLKLIQP